MVDLHLRMADGSMDTSRKRLNFFEAMELAYRLVDELENVITFSVVPSRKH